MSAKFSIDDKEITAKKGQTILESALAADIYIPHLCYHPDLPSFKEAAPSDACYRGEDKYHPDPQSNEYEGCGLCLIEIKDQKEPVLSCITHAEEGMEVLTSTPRIEALRQENLVKIFAHHPHACLTCAQKQGCSLTQCSTNVPEEERCCPQFDFCELRKVAEYVGIREDISRYKPRQLYSEEDKPLFIRDYNLCVGCLRCVRVCNDVIGAKALCYIIADGENIAGAKRPLLEESGCRFCGACVEVCPTGALRDKDLKPGDRRDSLVPCTSICPVGMDIPSYVRYVNEGKYAEAADVIREKVPLAMNLGYICPHPCEEECRRGKINQAIAICDLKRFALQGDGSKAQVQKGKETGKKVAVLGSGPAGLVAAYFLAKSGHSVTVYEAQEESGGMLRWAIPEYRLSRSIVEQEIESIKAMGVKILTSCLVTSQTFQKDLKKDRWDAIFLATGAQESKKIDVEGLSIDGIHWGLDFLREAKQGRASKLQGKIVVVGGGNVAIDVAMTALRIGASGVEIVCLEQRDEMLAFSWEILEAEEEGVVVHPGWGPLKIEGNGNRMKGIELQECTSVFDEKGNFSPSFDSSKRRFLEADVIILAVGQTSDLSYLPPDRGIKITAQENLEVNPETLETSIPGIFAGGEATLGPASAVEAMAAGRKAASSIDKFLGGHGDIDRPSEAIDVQRKSLNLGQEEDFYAKERVAMPCRSLTDRSKTFDLIRLGYGEDEARKEASRCLQCDLRFQISPVRLPPEKWLEFRTDIISQVPNSEGAFQLLDEEKKIIYIAGAPNLKQALEEQLSSRPEAKYFNYEQDPMYTKRESELIQQFLQTHGHLPPGNEEIEDLF